MSRTDVHMPYLAKAKDPAWRHAFREHHNHRDGICDLAEFIAADSWVQARCFIDFALIGRNIHCGCRECTGRDDRRVERRRDRHSWRRNLERYG